MKDDSLKYYNIISNDNILYLGVDSENFLAKRVDEKLTDVIFIGRLKRRKGLFEILELSQIFPELTFHIVGDGEGREKEELLVALNSLANHNNIKLHGLLNHAELFNLLKQCALHVFPSRQEGFPKVMLETAAAGIPTIMYSDYGATEWITHGCDGFVVDTLDQMIVTVRMLIAQPELLHATSKNAVSLALKFDWKIVVKLWEKELETMYITHE